MSQPDRRTAGNDRRAQSLRPSLLLFSLLLVPFVMGAPCDPVEPDEVKTIEDFVECLNDNIVGGDIADAVDCLPPKCTMTVTLSDGSAQPACTDGGCPLPRILLNCPGPPQLQPSFSLCVDDGGLYRVEIGETINKSGHMRMADVHIDPNHPWALTDPNTVLSKVGADPNGLDTKECWMCHQSVVAPPGALAISKPEPYEIFEQGCVIETNEPGEKPDPSDDCQFIGDITGFAGTGLEDICDCIGEGITGGDPNTFANDQGPVAKAICEALVTYRSTRGMCGSEECPPQEGPGCTTLDAHCNPYAGGATEAMPTGYTCQEVSEGIKQCVSSRMCVEYTLTGGGKFLDGGKVSFVRVDVTGEAAVEGDGPVCDSTDVMADMEAFNHDTNTLVNDFELSSFTVTIAGPNDFSAVGTGTALVDGSPMDVGFEANKGGGGVDFDVGDPNGTSSLAGGVGEAGRSDFELTETVLP